jgi:hypothetical protein
MKLYVKRDQFKVFEKGKIEFNDSWEWVMISSGLEKELEYIIETIEFYENLEQEQTDIRDYTKDIEEYKERKIKLEEMIGILDHKNELIWN